MLATLLLLVVGTPPAAAREWVVDGTNGRFAEGGLSGLEVSTAADVATLVLQRAILWSFTRTDAPLFGPFSAQPLPNGSVLITDRDNASVIEVSRAKSMAWSYTQRDDAQLVSPNFAERLPNGNTLIVDRRADRVFEVTRAKEVVWEYGVQSDSTAPGSLVDPYSATRLSNGNTLIVDNRGGTRVIEVRSSDYDSSSPTLGYTEASIVWRYGRDNDAGTGEGQLSSPRQAARLANGNTLIVDAADQEFAGNRVLEVDGDGNILWEFDGHTMSPPVKPSGAVQMPNGHFLIVAEEGNGSVYEVDGDGTFVGSYSSQDLFFDGSTAAKLRSVQPTRTGSLMISDQGNQRVYEVGFPAFGTLTSPTLDLELPGVKKTLGRIQVASDTPAGTAVAVEYSLDGGPWKAVGGDGALPAGTTAVTVRYRVTLSTSDQGISPLLSALVITYDIAPPPTTTTTHVVTSTTTAHTGTTRTTGGTGTTAGTSGTTGSSGTATGTSGTDSANTTRPIGGPVPPPMAEVGETAPRTTTTVGTVPPAIDADLTNGNVLDPSGSALATGTPAGSGAQGWGVALTMLVVPYLAGVLVAASGGSDFVGRLIPRPLKLR